MHILLLDIVSNLIDGILRTLVLMSDFGGHRRKGTWNFLCHRRFPGAREIGFARGLIPSLFKVF